MGRLLIKFASRPFLVRRALRVALERWDEFTDKVADRLREQVSGDVADFVDMALDRAAVEAIIQLIGNESVPDTEAVISRRVVAMAAVDLAKDNIRPLLDKINDRLDVPFVPEETEESWEQAAAGALEERMDTLASWIRQNL